MIKTISRVFALALVPLILAACGALSVANASPSASASHLAVSPTASASVAATPAATPVATPAPVPASVFVAQNMAIGAILTNAQGRTLYYFVPERGGRVSCTGQCAVVWPPLLSGSLNPTANASLPGKLAGVARAEGDQVTYSDWPLYTFAGDRAPDQTNGNGVFGFGGKWIVATPSLQP